MKGNINRYKRRSINLDDRSYSRCKELARGMSISISGLLRIIIKDVYEQHRFVETQDSSQSCLQP